MSTKVIPNSTEEIDKESFFRYTHYHTETSAYEWN